MNGLAVHWPNPSILPIPSPARSRVRLITGRVVLRFTTETTGQCKARKTWKTQAMSDPELL
jgi:hypothetical protein